MANLSEPSSTSNQGLRNSTSVAVDLSLVVFGVFAVIGSMGTWITIPQANGDTFRYAPTSYSGTTQVVARTGWVVAGFAAAIVAVTVTGLLRRQRASPTLFRLVGASLFGSSLLVSVVAVINAHLLLSDLGLPSSGLNYPGRQDPLAGGCGSASRHRRSV